MPYRKQTTQPLNHDKGATCNGIPGEMLKGFRERKFWFW